MKAVYPNVVKAIDNYKKELRDGKHLGVNEVNYMHGLTQWWFNAQMGEVYAMKDYALPTKGRPQYMVFVLETFNGTILKRPYLVDIANTEIDDGGTEDERKVFV